LQKAALGETQQIERCFCFERFDSFPASSDSPSILRSAASKIFGEQFFFVSLKRPARPLRTQHPTQMDHLISVSLVITGDRFSFERCEYRLSLGNFSHDLDFIGLGSSCIRCRTARQVHAEDICALV